MSASAKKLLGLTALVTAGPTIERLDPVRYLSNFSSGKQGYAIANALHEMGAKVILVSGPTQEQPPVGVTIHRVESAEEMNQICMEQMPVDIAICVAAVCDWRAKNYQDHKIKKDPAAKQAGYSLQLIPNPDILHHIATHKKRPKLVIGFAAETQDILENAKTKRMVKQCDWMVANAVTQPETPLETVFGSDKNNLWLVKSSTEVVEFGVMTKTQAANQLVNEIVRFMAPK